MPQPKNTLDDFRTSDLGIAAALVAWEQPLLRVSTNGGRAVFIFPPSAAALSRRYFEVGKDLVSARRFHLALRELRGLARGVSE